METHEELGVPFFIRKLCYCEVVADFVEVLIVGDDIVLIAQACLVSSVDQFL